MPRRGKASAARVATELEKQMADMRLEARMSTTLTLLTDSANRGMRKCWKQWCMVVREMQREEELGSEIGSDPF